jgi:hypothetical protein
MNMSMSFWDSLWQTLFVQGAALTIALAGLSDGLGTQSIVLLVNRITPLRFALNLLLSVALYVLGALAWMAAIWLATRVVLRDDVPLAQVIGAVSLAYIPLWFSVLALIPYLGQAIGPILNGWSLVIALFAVSQVFQFGLIQALTGTALGWLSMLLVRAVVSRPAARLDHWLWAITTGRDTRIDIDNLPLTGGVDVGTQVAETKGAP